MSTQATPQPPEGLYIAAVPIGRLTPNPDNPRKHFDPTKLQELADSIGQVGLVQPLVVRPFGKPGHYQIVAGERRWRAAQLAKAPTVPAIERRLTDQQALEIMTIENLQRDDLHPLEEAQGYSQLQKIDPAQYTVQGIAAKVGKSESYVYQRLKLLSLGPQAVKCFYAGDLPAAHAISLARLQPEDQRKALEELMGDRDFNGLMPLREFNQYIAHEFHLDLHGAAFDKADSTLVPEAGSCLACPKRTGFAPQLFADLKTKKDTCTDATCFWKKVAADLARKREALAAELGRPPVLVSSQYTQRPRKDGVLARDAYKELDRKSKPCGHAVPALVMDGGRAGHRITVCATQDCRTHWHPFEQESQENRAQRTKQKQRRIEALVVVRRRLLDAIVGAAPSKLVRRDLNHIAVGWFDSRRQDVQKIIYRRHAWEPVTTNEGGYRHKVWGGAVVAQAVERMTEKELNGFLIELALIDLATVNEYRKDYRTTPPALLEVARRWGCAPNQIEREVTAEFAEKAKRARQRAKKAAAGQAQEPTAGICQICGCTENSPCEISTNEGTEPCGWANKEKTLCTTPECLKAGKLAAKRAHVAAVSGKAGAKDEPAVDSGAAPPAAKPRKGKVKK